MTVASGLPAADIQHRMPALDGLRALAVLLVIPHNIDLLNSPAHGWLRAPSVLFHSGWIGVTLFFVLSGFLITGNLLDVRGAGNYFSSFYARRALRIFPLYFGVLIGCFWLLPLLHAMPAAMAATAKYQLPLWLFFSNWTAPNGHSVEGLGPFWSLAIEEQFYLAWPLFVWRTSARTVCITSGILIGSAFLLRFVLHEIGVSHETLYMNTFTRIDALAAGAAAAALLRIPAPARMLKSHMAPILTATFLALGITFGLTHALSIYDAVTQTMGYLVLALAFGVLVLAAATEAALPEFASTILKSRAAASIGRYSYGMYVFHLPLHLFILAPLFARWISMPNQFERVLYMVAALVISFALAAASFELFERPFLTLRSRFIPYFTQCPAVHGSAKANC